MYQAQRPSAVARRKRQQRAATIKTIITAAATLATFWAIVWLGYFATI